MIPIYLGSALGVTAQERPLVARHDAELCARGFFWWEQRLGFVSSPPTVSGSESRTGHPVVFGTEIFRHAISMPNLGVDLSIWLCKLVVT